MKRETPPRVAKSVNFMKETGLHCADEGKSQQLKCRMKFSMKPSSPPTFTAVRRTVFAIIRWRSRRFEIVFDLAGDLRCLCRASIRPPSDCESVDAVSYSATGFPLAAVRMRAVVAPGGPGCGTGLGMENPLRGCVRARPRPAPAGSCVLRRRLALDGRASRSNPPYYHGRLTGLGLHFNDPVRDPRPPRRRARAGRLCRSRRPSR